MSTEQKAVTKKKAVAKKKVAKKKAAVKKKAVASTAPVSTKSAVKKRVAKKAAAKKAAPGAAARKPAIDPQMRYEMIEKMAYYRAKERNFAPGHEHNDWLESEKAIDEMLNKQ